MEDLKPLAGLGSPAAPPADGAPPAPPGGGAAPDVVATVSDRRVRIPPASEPDPSTYRLVREWVQNDPELYRVQIAPLVGVDLPPLGPGGGAPPAAPPPRPPPLEVAEGAEPPPPEALLKEHVAYWRAERAAARQRADERAARYASRLQMAMGIPRQ